jgi:hypothetical protein
MSVLSDADSSGDYFMESLEAVRSVSRWIHMLSHGSGQFNFAQS